MAKHTNHVRVKQVFDVPEATVILFPGHAEMNIEQSARTWRAPLDTATVRKRMGVVALAVPSQLGAASPSAGDSRRSNGGSGRRPPGPEADYFFYKSDNYDQLIETVNDLIVSSFGTL